MTASNAFKLTVSVASPMDVDEKAHTYRIRGPVDIKFLKHQVGALNAAYEGGIEFEDIVLSDTGEVTIHLRARNRR